MDMGYQGVIPKWDKDRLSASLHRTICSGTSSQVNAPQPHFSHPSVCHKHDATFSKPHRLHFQITIVVTSRFRIPLGSCGSIQHVGHVRSSQYNGPVNSTSVPHHPQTLHLIRPSASIAMTIPPACPYACIRTGTLPHRHPAPRIS